jgi:type IV conjugative transfer system lipoprotein TraV
MNKLVLGSALLVAAALSGCVSPGYECALKPNEAGKCASVQDAYAAANRTAGSKAKRESVFDMSHKEDAAQQQPGQYFNPNSAGLPDTPENGMPVFKQPQVHRVWVAPYVDADGNLRSGEYTYFTTPGEWNYGSLHKPGAASGAFGPARPNDVGFASAPEQKKAAPGAPTQSPPQPEASKTNPQQVATPQTGGSAVTQPAQRF